MKKILIVSISFMILLVSFKPVYGRPVDNGPCTNKGHLEGGGVGTSSCQSCNFKICEKITGWASSTLTGKCVTANGCTVTGGCDGGR